ncbi:hypothetical protein [Salinimicrobium sp. TH3]|uniref:hypothetical protein n=1 Tax=Salinimicrobium sp. TH3 TaxID=2997342 RepID=UPI002276F25E|nr:hypothetical protein [Salinimicrobium sp. TH3]MCY2685933.1 hypothetical protein [Salinimicrobium sp. TH3]
MKQTETNLDPLEDSREIRVSIMIKTCVMEEIKRIAELEDSSPKDLINKALLRKIRDFRKNHDTGTIT